jgi:hypothetical protein
LPNIKITKTIWAEEALSIPIHQEEIEALFAAKGDFAKAPMEMKEKAVSLIDSKRANHIGMRER